jgi:hypothetical protein
MRTIYVNSTVAAREAMCEHGGISPLHYWGYLPQTGDCSLAHRFNRYEIVLRSRLRGLDLSLLIQTIFLMAGGRRSLYLVTQPDLLVAVPFLRRCFPKAPIITWAWTDEEARKWFKQYSYCSHVLCLTEPAREELLRLGLPESRCSFHLWGTDPAFYQRAEVGPVANAVLFCGLAGRDVEIVRKALIRAPFTMTVAPLSAAVLQLDPGTNVRILHDQASYEAVVDMLHSSRIVWIPLLPGADPTGFTNLVEALLCGTGVVIDDSSTIPKGALTLPGVYLYRHGDADSLVEVTNQALIAARSNDFRPRVREAAAAALNGRSLHKMIEAVLSGQVVHRAAAVPSGLTT